VTANEARRQSEVKHRLLFESSRDAIVMLAPPALKFTEANPPTLQMFGAKTMEPRRNHEAEREAIRNDGSRVKVRIRAIPIEGEDGSISGVVEVIEDVTER
jgi:PAS domain-containing protein